MITEKRRLGRGLDALLGGISSQTSSDAESAALAAPAPTTVPIDRITTCPFQPRRDFDADELAALKQSLATHGLLQPVLVRPVEDGYQLIAGERRLRAAREVGWTEIPVHVVDFNDQATFEAALVENLQRSDLNPIEKAQGFHDYLQRYQLTQEELARKIGLDRSTIANLIRLLELPATVQEAVRLGQVSGGHARALVTLDDPARQEGLCREIIAKGLS
ncbi:MAG TPA: ParB/RepB/Spo0J family partition protein, partial [Gemmatales bacterium]|nr:ParB/RepB/Spo0J family partition protein [Gemmatales bacterium]